MPTISSALFNSLQDVINRAKANAMSIFKGTPKKPLTGRLENSLTVLAARYGDTSVEIDIGSDLPGYPFFQEYGWTTRSGNHVPAKLFFTSAVYTSVEKVNDDVVTAVGAMAGGK